MPHSIALYTDDTLAEPLFVGEIVTGPATIDYEIPAIPAGDYYFHCDVHPNMSGSLVVSGESAGGGGGGDPPPEEGGGGTADASIAAEGTAFDTASLSWPADTEVTLTFDNRDDAAVAGQHNVSIYDGDTALFRYGWDAALAWVTYNNEPPTVTLWPAPRTGAAGEIDQRWPAHQPTTWVTGGARVDEPALALDPMRAGTAFAQDEASTVVGVVAAAAARSPLLDACAAPGGKTLVLDARLPTSIRILAADRRAPRVATLQALLQRYGNRAVPLLRADATALPFVGSLGSVLIDAPCSGLGTLRRDPDIKWRRQAGDLSRLASAQRAMLEMAARAVKRDGRVIYATCSSEPEENEDLVAEICRERGWRIVPIAVLDLPERVRSLVTPDGWLRTLPHRHGLDAFFVAVLEPAAAGDPPIDPTGGYGSGAEGPRL